MIILNVYFVKIDCLLLGISQLESRLIKQTDFGKQISMSFCKFSTSYIVMLLLYFLLSNDTILSYLIELQCIILLYCATIQLFPPLSPFWGVLPTRSSPSGGRAVVFHCKCFSSLAPFQQLSFNQMSEQMKWFHAQIFHRLCLFVLWNSSEHDHANAGMPANHASFSHRGVRLRKKFNSVNDHSMTAY